MLPDKMTHQPPIAARIPHVAPYREQPDDYGWLRERDNPAVIDYLDAENRYLEARLAGTEQLQEQLYREMRARIKETDLSVPERRGEYIYYIRTEENRQYPIYCRKHRTLDAPEEILLDQNLLAQDHEYTAVGVLKVSPDDRLLAYSVDHSGYEHYTLFIKNLVDGSLLDDRLTDTYYSVEWAADSRTLLYSTLDEASRPYKVFRHVLGTAQSDDVQIFHEEDETFYLSLRKSKSKRYLLIRLASTTTSEEWSIPTHAPQEPPRVLQPRQRGLEYIASHHGGWFYITNNRETGNGRAVDFQVDRAPVETPDLAHWEQVIPHTAGVKIDRVEAFRDQLVLHQRSGGLRQLKILPIIEGEPDPAAGHVVSFPEEVYTIWGGSNPEFESSILRLTYTSLVTPATVYDYDMETQTPALLKQEEVLGGYDASAYVTRRLWARAADGVEVPISVVHRRDLDPAATHPTWLYGYGSYGASIDPTFNANRVSLLDRGFIYAIAHIRGGGEMGRGWYENGKLLKKKNTFTDFVSCAEHLIQLGFTTPDQLVIAGRSAGGLLMGAVLNMRPDLFQAAIAGVPFVDVINTMSDPSIPLTTGEYQEWGNPAEPDFFDYMQSYSPYDNVEAKSYPHILATAGLNDPRVHYWEPAKWVAKLRAVKQDDNMLLLKTNMNAGHSGASGRFDYLREVALEYAFFLEALDLE